MTATSDAENVRFSLIVFQIIGLARADGEAPSVAVACLPILDQLARAVIDHAVQIDHAEPQPTGPHLAPAA